MSLRGIKQFIVDMTSSASSVLNVMQQSKHPQALAQATDQACIILGNGPSLKDTLVNDIDKLRQAQLFCVNDFVLSPLFMALKPQYYLLADPDYWAASNNENTQALQETITTAFSKTDWPLLLITPFEAKGSQFLAALPDNITVHFQNNVNVSGFKGLEHYYFRRNLAMPAAQNVLIMATFMALNIGYKKIYLVGADHNWHEDIHVDDNNQLCIRRKHFYGEAKITPWLKPGTTNETFSVPEIFQVLFKTFEGYHQLAEYAGTLDACIINSSTTSTIDAFKKQALLS